MARIPRIFDRSRLLLLLSLLLVGGFLTTSLVGYQVSKQVIHDAIIGQDLPLTSSNIYSEIQKDLVTPILVSSTMAHDTFLRDWVVRGEKNVEEAARYLKEIRHRYGAFSSFFVSEKTATYYTGEGILKRVSPREPRDVWYYRVRDMKEAYEINVDPDLANKDALTIFINYRVFDFKGNYIGATGVGLTVDAVRNLIADYQRRFNRKIYFVDAKGKIVLFGEQSGHPDDLRTSPGLGPQLDRILEEGRGSYQYRADGDNHILNVNYLPELKWYLFVEQNEDAALTGIRRTLYANLAISLAVTLVVLFLSHLVLSRYQQRFEEMAHLEALEQSREVLERQVAERTAELEVAREAAVAASHAKSRFLATMSHEIRTPMNGILGMAQLLMTGRLTEDQRREYGRTIYDSGQTLLTLLNDILDLSKVEAGKFELADAAFDPKQIVEDIAALFGKSAESKGLRFEAGWRGAAGQRYRSDPVRLRQMLANLASNAVKFTEHGFVRIDVAEVEREAGKALLEFSVSDSGPGIPPDKRPLLFHTFSQLDGSSTRHHGGTGLGLSIVRNLAKLMDGDVGVESEAGKGSRFWFRIRADVVAERAERLHSGNAAEGHGLDQPAKLSGYVLVVEDNMTNRNVIKALLGNLGLTADIVENGRDAVDAVTQGLRPDLVLMDVQMPVMDGLEATARIRQWEKETLRPRLPIIALTAGAFEEDRNNCVAAGMDDYLSKPVSMDRLSSILAKWLVHERQEGGPPAGP